MHRTLIIFGFSGAGKSTVAVRIAKRLGLRVIHPSSIVRDLIEGKRVDIARTKAGTGFWETPRGVRMFKDRLREQCPVDAVSDKILLKEIARGNVVMDSWSMPWLSARGVKIYLRASYLERVRRVAKRSGISLKRARMTVRLKDEATRKLYVRLHGFDMKKDTEVFDMIIDTTHLSIPDVVRAVTDFLKKIDF